MAHFLTFLDDFSRDSSCLASSGSWASSVVRRPRMCCALLESRLAFLPTEIFSLHVAAPPGASAFSAARCSFDVVGVSRQEELKGDVCNRNSVVCGSSCGWSRANRASWAVHVRCSAGFSPSHFLVWEDGMGVLTYHVVRRKLGMTCSFRWPGKKRGSGTACTGGQ